MPVMNRRSLSLFLVPIFAAAAAFTFTLTFATAPSAEQLLACVSEDASYDGNEVDASQLACVTETLTQAASADRLVDIASAMNQLNASNLPLCHRAAHEAGSRLWPSDGEWAPVLATVDTSLCNSGLLHGLFDKMATVNFSEADWKDVATWCSTRTSKFTNEANCADAMGHASWDDTKSRLGSYDRCALLGTTTLVVECIEGVEMQRFTPASRLDGWEKLDPEKLLRLCDDITDAYPAEYLAGCANGFAFLSHEAIRQQPDTRDPWRNIPATQRFNSGVVAGCEEIAPEHARACITRYLWLFKYQMNRRPPAESIEAFCPPLGVYEPLCAEQLSKPLT